MPISALTDRLYPCSHVTPDLHNLERKKHASTRGLNEQHHLFETATIEGLKHFLSLTKKLLFWDMHAFWKDFGFCGCKIRRNPPWLKYFNAAGQDKVSLTWAR